MVETVHCIVLRMVKYSDSASIATVWSAERGRMAVAVPSGNGREAQRRRAIMMPLGAFEAVARSKPGREVVHVSDVRPIVESPAASGNPARSVIAMFLADFLYTVLKESTYEPLLSDFLFSSLAQLAQARGTELANFHLMFAYRLGHFLGISPDTGTYQPGRYFDMREARFTSTPPVHTQYLAPPQAELVRILSRLNSRNLGLLKLSRVQRNEILDAILQYYSLHYAPVQHMPSLAVLREIWND